MKPQITTATTAIHATPRCSTQYCASPPVLISAKGWWDMPCETCQDQRTSTGAPSCSRLAPLVTTSSPGFNPSETMIELATISPVFTNWSDALPSLTTTTASCVCRWFFPEPGNDD